MQDNILFVPGRLSLIGGISDLVVPYLSKDSELSPGKAIAVTINNGIYSKATKCEKFIYKYNDIYYECKMDEENLKQECKNDNFFSYICGTLLYMLRVYKEKISGIYLEIVEVDLPIKKGLASSAAICITVVKHINRLYNLCLSKEEIIDIAYNGEHLAGSKCGLLDQTTIMNAGLTEITFLSEKTKTRRLTPKSEMNFLVVDLNATKDTRKIMNFFNNAMNFPKESDNQKVYNLLKSINYNLVTRAADIIEKGNLNEFGEILKKFQDYIDSFGESCDELKAPILHRILEDNYLKENTYGAKGTGSGGDGIAMLLCKSKNLREEIKFYVKEKYGMSSISVDIK